MNCGYEIGFQVVVVVLLVYIAIGVYRIMSSTDPLAAISTAVADLTAAVTIETATLNLVLAALQKAQGNGLNPAEVADLAAKIEASVGNLNTANTAAQAVINPPPPPPPAPAV